MQLTTIIEQIWLGVKWQWRWDQERNRISAFSQTVDIYLETQPQPLRKLPPFEKLEPKSEILYILLFPAQSFANGIKWIALSVCCHNYHVCSFFFRLDQKLNDLDHLSLVHNKIFLFSDQNVKVSAFSVSPELRLDGTLFSEKPKWPSFPLFFLSSNLRLDWTLGCAFYLHHQCSKPWLSNIHWLSSTSPGSRNMFDISYLSQS